MIKSGWIFAVSLMFGLMSAPSWAQGGPMGTPATPGGGAMTPERQAMMRDMVIMMQNTAVWTPQGLVVLQGNRLVGYGTDLQLRRTVTLPAPATGTGTASVRSMVPPKLIPTDDGVIVIRGQQIIRLDRELRVVNQAMLPDLPQPTAAEMSAICPMCAQMMMMMMGMGGMGGPATGTGTTGQGAPPAGTPPHAGH